jgi:hypothetical protein
LSGPKDCNIDLFETVLYVNNYNCSFTIIQPLCDTRLPLSADGAFGDSPNHTLDLSEVILAINNYQCNSIEY